MYVCPIIKTWGMGSVGQSRQMRKRGLQGGILVPIRIYVVCWVLQDAVGGFFEENFGKKITHRPNPSVIS